MRQKCEFRLQPHCGVDGFVQRKMSGVWFRSQRVKNENFDTLQQFPTFVWNVIRIGTVRNVSDPKAKHIESRTVL